MNRRKRPNQAGALETFDPLPWFAAISKALETENRPFVRIAIHDAQEEIQIFSGKFPPEFPLNRVPQQDLKVLLMFLVSLMQVGVAPPGWPRVKRGNYVQEFALVAVG